MSKQARLEELKISMASAALPLKDGHNLVFGKGSPDAAIMLVGEAPGEREDKEGVPFVGAAGKKLDDLLGSVGLSVDDVYIANILKYRPPGNRDPDAGEIRAHTPFLVEQIKIIQPKIIVTLGNFATKFVLAGFSAYGMEMVEGITRIHGKVKQAKLGDSVFLVFPTYHPAAVMYNPALRKEIEEDFALLGRLVEKS